MYELQVRDIRVTVTQYYLSREMDLVIDKPINQSFMRLAIYNNTRFASAHFFKQLTNCDEITSYHVTTYYISSKDTRWIAANKYEKVSRVRWSEWLKGRK